MGDYRFISLLEGDWNILLVGGPIMNRLSKYLVSTDSDSDGDHDDVNNDDHNNDSLLKAKLPVSFKCPGCPHDNGHRPGEEGLGFIINGRLFDRSQDASIFTFPLKSTSSSAFTTIGNNKSKSLSNKKDMLGAMI